MRTVIALLLITLACSETLVGGWVKRTFAENDLFLDRARVTAENQYYSETGTNDSEVDLSPLCVYSQLVNGLNFKIVFSARNMKTNALDLYEYQVYSGPFGGNNVPQPKVTKSTKLQKGKPLLFAAAEYTDIHKAISSYYSTSNSLSHISSVVKYESPLDGLQLFIVKAQVNDEPLKKTCVVVEENGKMEQIAEIRSY